MPAVRQLAQELGLNLDKTFSRLNPPGTEDFFWVNGGRVPILSTGRRPERQSTRNCTKDVTAASYPDALESLHPARAGSSNHMSIIQWLDENCSKRWIEVEPRTRARTSPYNIEYGAECSVQSSLNLLYTCSATAARASSGSSATRTRSTHVRGGPTTRSRNGSLRRLANQISHRH